MNSINVEDLLQQARAASLAGEGTVAESLLRQASELAPDRVDVWLELSGAVSDLAEKRHFLERALEVDPSNAEAHSALAWIRKKETILIERGEMADPRLQAIPRAQSVGQPAAVATAEREPAVYCARHPDVETALRCNRCGTPICPKCAVRTPVGFRCPDCVKAQSAVFFTAGWFDYVLGGAVALVLSIVAGYIISLIPWLFTIFVAPAAGAVIGEAVFRVTRRRRGRQMWLLAAAAIVVGALVPLVGPALLFGRVAYLFSMNQLLTSGIFIVMGIGTAVARLK
jgi:hypothetical protein